MFHKLKKSETLEKFLGTLRKNYLRQFNPSRPNPGRREKIKVNFYFHASLWSLKGLHKTF